MIGRMVGAALGGAIGKEKNADPVKGAVIGAATMFVARRMLPRRVAAIGAAVAAGYVTRKLAQRAERRSQTQRLLPAPSAAPATPAPSVRTPTPLATTGGNAVTPPTAMP